MPTSERKRNVSWPVVFITVSLLAYVLGVGPATRIRITCASENLSHFIRCFYAPLYWAEENTPDLIRMPLKKYIRYWCSDIPYPT